ncbi:MAG TPA: DUF58 domain-containing protein, partial [Anaerolineales bacterium]|nr:DUF58 domain-containing protein [Anaerolineales bacterium]
MSPTLRLGRVLAERLDRLRRLRRPTCEVSLHLRSPLLPVACALFAAWQALRPGPIPLAGLALTGSLLATGLFWAWSMATRVSTRRVLRLTSLQVGDHLEEILYLDNRSRLPVVFAEIVDHTTLPGYAIDGVRVVGGRASRQWRLQTVCRQRGVFSLGVWDVILGDPFGLFHVRQRYREPREVTVFPSLAALPAGTTRHRTRGDRSVLRQPLPAETVSAMTTRPYSPGDSLRRIHWRTTARHDELYVRTFEPEAASAMWLILDLDKKVHFGHGTESSLEKMIMAAAGLASWLLDQRVPTGMVLEAEGTQVVPPKTSRSGLWAILHALALVGPGATPLSAALERAGPVVSVRDSLTILTPSLDPSWAGALPAAGAGA